VKSDAGLSGIQSEDSVRGHRCAGWVEDGAAV